MSLDALFRLPAQAALDYLAAKGLRPTWNWWEMQGAAHAQAFTVAKLAQLDLLADIRAALVQALAEGKSERWFGDTLKPLLQKKGWWGPQVDVGADGQAQLYQAGSFRRLQTIYRTNLQSAYMAGRQQQFDAERERAPFVQYLAVMDSRTRPSHSALHGRVFRLEDPAWNVIAPPNGYNCRCRARNFSQDELDARDLKVETQAEILTREPPGRRPVDPRSGETPGSWVQRGVRVPNKAGVGLPEVLWADVGWDWAPGRGDKGLSLLEARVLARADELGGDVPRLVKADIPPDLKDTLGIPPYLALVQEAEGAIAAAPVETTVVFDASGFELLRKVGGADSVSFSAAERPLLKDAVVTHNHPVDTSFSISDIETLIKNDAAVMRAVDSTFSYHAERPAGGWKAGEVDQIRQVILDSESIVWGEWVGRLLRGDIDQATFNREIYHDLWERVAAVTRLMYQRDTR